MHGQVDSIVGLVDNSVMANTSHGLSFLLSGVGALRVGVDDPAPDHRLEITRALELLKENAWATRERAAGTGEGSRGLREGPGR